MVGAVVQPVKDSLGARRWRAAGIGCAAHPTPFGARKIDVAEVDDVAAMA